MSTIDVHYDSLSRYSPPEYVLIEMPTNMLLISNTQYLCTPYALKASRWRGDALADDAAVRGTYQP